MSSFLAVVKANLHRRRTRRFTSMVKCLKFLDGVVVLMRVKHSQKVDLGCINDFTPAFEMERLLEYDMESFYFALRGAGHMLSDYRDTLPRWGAHVVRYLATSAKFGGNNAVSTPLPPPFRVVLAYSCFLVVVGGGRSAGS